MTDTVSADQVETAEPVVSKLTGIRKVAARRMVQAWAAPVFHLGVDIDMGAVLAADLKSAGCTVTDAILRACTRALLANPGLNAHYTEDPAPAVTTFSQVHLGLAVATDNGLTVPVLHDLQSASLSEIAGQRKDLVARARIGKLGMKDITGGTFTVSNLGMMGIARFDAILNPPQVGILAIGSTSTVPVVREGAVGTAQLASFTLTCDHRAVDGATGAGLLAEIKRSLESGDAVR